MMKSCSGKRKPLVIASASNVVTPSKPHNFHFPKKVI